jgi:hypothetical protein
MNRRYFFAATAAAAFALSLSACTENKQFGSPDEARAMLDKAAAAIVADKTKALDQFAKGEGGFKDRDLYPFCFNASDGIITAGPAAVMGTDVRQLKDNTGKEFGTEMFAGAAEGKVIEVSYMWPRPGEDKTPVLKTSYVTRAGDQACGVGYYRQ